MSRSPATTSKTTAKPQQRQATLLPPTLKPPKIEEGIPVPSTMRQHLAPWPFEDMKPGHSFLIECAAEDRARVLNNLATAARNWKKRMRKDSWVFAARQVEDGVRMWRTK